jgi:putative oligomerization/nucleic acid binding protein
VRFLDDRLALFESFRRDVLTELLYGQVEDVEIGGPGLIKTGGGFVGGGFGVTGAVEGMGIVAVLNALTTRTSIKTVMRIQGTGCELFLLHPGLTPEKLRIEMSRQLAAIRSARAAKESRGIKRDVRTASASPVDELTKLADLLERGLLTREEFDLMKAKFLDLPTI